MTISRYSPTHYEKEIKIIAGWIEASDSGKVVGLPGSGKSNLLQLICRHPEVLAQHLTNSSPQIALIPVDLNDLPTLDLTTFYRLILRSLAENQTVFLPVLHPLIGQTYATYWREQDPFVVQSVLRALLFRLQTEQVRLVLILDRFNTFCERRAPPEIFDTLRGLRDSFKANLCYIVGLRYELSYLPDVRLLGELLDLLDAHTCWVGALCRADALQFIRYELEQLPRKLTQSEEQQILELSGHYPAVLKAICRWWRSTPEKPPSSQLIKTLLGQDSIRYRFEVLWTGLTQEEQHLLAELLPIETKKGNGCSYKKWVEQHEEVLEKLAQKGVCRLLNEQWQVNGLLLRQFVTECRDDGLGRISYDRETVTFWQGVKRLDLTPQQQVALEYMLVHPYRPLSKTDLLTAIWPNEWEEVDEARLYQLVRQLRRKIEPHSARPVYLVH